jgi:hypothetical protein
MVEIPGLISHSLKLSLSDKSFSKVWFYNKCAQFQSLIMKTTDSRAFE